jgi:stage II sporulation protein M
MIKKTSAPRLQLRDITTELKIAIVIFVAALLIGFLNSANPPEFITTIMNEFIDMAESIGIENTVDLFSFIVINNLIAVFSVVTAGLLFGISPLLSTVINGYLIGIVTGEMIRGGELVLVIAGIVPHGLLELPALFMAIGTGLYLGKQTFMTMKRVRVEKSFIKKIRRTIQILAKDLVASLKFAWVIITPLIVIAALIEATATPALIDYFTSL